MRWFFKPFNTTIALLTLLILNGCTSTVDKSVVEFVKKTKSQRPRKIEKLPEFKAEKPLTFTGSNLRNPFEPFMLGTSEKPGTLRAEPRPDLNRPKEPLEQYPLDSFRMVGTLERHGVFYALLRDATGRVHLVSVGNYVGQNSGKIEKINETGLNIKEWVSNGKGGWREHWANIPLSK